jgi:ligand-binding sensor domain-containing protein/two-component sensor histidine kinase
MFPFARCADANPGADGRNASAHTLSKDSQSEYLVEVWGTDEGLPNNTVTGIAQTPDGYLWCSTYDGAVRFDGVRFVRIGPDDSTSQQANRIQCLYVDRRGQLWMGTDGAGVLRYADGAFTAFTERAGSSADVVRCLAEDAVGDLWLGTRGGLGRLRDGKATWFTSAAGVTNAANSIWNIAFDREGRLWIADWNSLKAFKDGRFESALLRPELKVPMRAMYADAAGDLWAGMMGEALRRDAGGQWIGIGDEGQFANAEVTAFCRTRSGDFWVGTRKGLCRQRNGQWTAFTARDGLVSSEVRALFEDGEGNIWVGTGTAGLARLKRRVLNTFTARHGLTDGGVFALCESTEGGLWVGLNDGRLVQRTAGSSESFEGFKHFSGDAPVKSVLRARDGALWVGTFGNGLVRFHNGQTTQFVPSVGSPARIDKVTALLQDRAGDVWVGTFYSLYKATSTNVLVPVPVDGRELRAPITALLEDGSGGVWVGFDGLGVARLDQGKATWLTRREGLPSHFIRALHQDRSGTLWIGTASGLCSWRESKISTFTKAHGLMSDAITQILEDDADNLWLGSSAGIMRVSRRDFVAVSEGREPSLEVLAFGCGEGMLSAECSGGFSPAGLRTKDGKLWFPTAKGLVMLDPPELKLTMNSTPPAVYIEEVRADGKLVAQPHVSPGVIQEQGSRETRVVLPRRTRRLEFIYTALSLTAPERVRFKHRLLGLDSDWTEAGTARSAVYAKLLPGSYRFQVIACNHDGIWNQAGRIIAFRIAAPFWRMGWFLLLAGVVSAGILGGTIRFVSVRQWQRKLRRVEEAHAIEKERMRIAKDIHDDVGANLTQIALLGELARQDRAVPEKAGGHIEKISNIARQAIRSLDEIVWAVNPRNDTLAHLIDYVGQYSLDYLRTAGIRCRLDLPDQSPARELSADVRHNLFLVVKEALNNIVKHAHASEVRLWVNVTGEGLRMTIEDDGCGFEQPPDNPTADGLQNMRQRLADIGGECSIESRSEAGTRIVVALRWPPGQRVAHVGTS